jgi:hypothetical protein
MKKVIFLACVIAAIWIPVANSYGENCDPHSIGVSYRRIGAALLDIITLHGRTAEEIDRRNAAMCPRSRR